MQRMTSLIICASIALSTLGGCAPTYRTPGGPAVMSIFGLSEQARESKTDPEIREVVMKQPLASFPAGLAVARVQAPEYRNHRVGSYGRGAYSLVTTRDVETEQDFERIRKLPRVRSVSPVSRLMLPDQLESDIELRRAAAALGADMLLIYTFDTQYKNDDWAPPLSLITLGIFPTEKTQVTTDATAVLLDVRNGFVYGSMEATSKQSRINNYWTDDEAADSARRGAEREALDGLIAGLETTWAGVLSTYGQPAAPVKPVSIEEDWYNRVDVGCDVPRVRETWPGRPQGPTYSTNPTR